MHRNMAAGRCGRGLLLVGWLVAAVVVGGVAATGRAAEAKWPFFAFDSGVGRGQWTPAEQAATLKELGYDGIGYWHTNNAELKERQAAFQQAGLKIMALGVRARLDRPLGYEPDLKETIELLKGSDTILYVLFDCRYTVDDEKLAELVGAIADLAQPAGVRVAVFPRFGSCVGSTPRAGHIAQLAKRPNAGAAFSLVADLQAGYAERLPEIIKASAPQLLLAAINGADLASKQYVLPLGEGDFDVLAVLKALQAAGYQGPVGLQSAKPTGDPRSNLQKSMEAWKQYQ